MQKGRVVGWLALALSIMNLAGCAEDGGAQGSSALEEPQAIGGAQLTGLGEAREPCFFVAGDLNGDGLEDFVISDPRDPNTFQPRARIIFGSGISLKKQDLLQRGTENYPGFSLFGPKAAPFICGPQGAPRDSAAADGTWQSRQSTVNSMKSLQMKSSVASNPFEGPPRYEVVNLSELAPGQYSNAYGIGPNGKVVGNFLTRVNGDYYEEHAYLYEDGALRDLGTLGGHFSTATDLNASDQVVGYSLTGEVDEMGFVNAAFVWDGVTMRNLGIVQASASKINESGQIVGERNNGHSIMAFLYDGGAITDLGSLDGGGSWALSLNNRGQIVGISSARIPGTDFPSSRGFLYQDGTLTDLGSFGPACANVEGHLECFEYSSATDLNNEGQIVGYSSSPSFATHAFRIRGQGMEDLGTLGGSQSWAQAVNDSGQIVGSALNADESYRAFLFDQDRMYDLNDLIVESQSGAGPIWGAMDINNFGQIVGSNYLLNPLYPMVTPEKELVISTTLGSRLGFEYWFYLGKKPGNCFGRFPSPQLQVRISLPELNQIPPQLRAYLNRWHGMGAPDVGCESSENWHTANLPIPNVLQGRKADITIRLRNVGRSLEPTAHLRHFGSD